MIVLAFMFTLHLTRIIDGVSVDYTVLASLDGQCRYSMHAKPWPIGVEETGVCKLSDFFK